MYKRYGVYRLLCGGFCGGRTDRTWHVVQRPMSCSPFHCVALLCFVTATCSVNNIIRHMLRDRHRDINVGFTAGRYKLPWYMRQQPPAPDVWKRRNTIHFVSCFLDRLTAATTSTCAWCRSRTAWPAPASTWPSRPRRSRRATLLPSSHRLSNCSAPSWKGDPCAK